MSKELAQEHGLKEAEFCSLQSLAERVLGNLEEARTAFEKLADAAVEAGLEVASLNARLQLGLCAWNEGDHEEARGHFEEVRRGARAIYLRLSFTQHWGCICFAVQRKWSDVEVYLIQAEDLRFDMRLRPRSRKITRQHFPARESAHREDLFERLDKLDVLTSRQSLSHDSL